MPVSRRRALGLAGGAAALHLVPGGTSASLLGAAAAQDAAPNPFACIASVMDFEPRARERISPIAYEFTSGGAGDELSLKWNREAYDRIRLRTRVLVDVSRLDTRVRLFGQELAHPILLAPTAYHKLVHPEGEVETARGAGAATTTMVVSSFATTAVEDIARAATQPLWFQLYVQPDRGFTKALVQRAEAAGCKAICVTVDTPLAGARNREERAAFRLPPGMDIPHLRGLPTAGARSAPREGRPYLFALGVAGASGVSRSVTILRRELQIAMALTGRRSISEIDSSVLWGA